MENSYSRSSSLVRQRSNRYSIGCSGSLGSVIRKSGPTKRSSSAAFRRADRLVVAREVQDDEQVVVVLVDLRALVAREDVLVVERMELEALLEPRLVDRPRALDVDPAQAGRLDDLDARLVALRRRRSAARDARRGDRTGLGAGSAWRGLSGSSVGAASRRGFYASAEVPLALPLLHSSTHPEGWRDWPYETPPTISVARRETVAIPSGSKTTAWEMR